MSNWINTINSLNDFKKIPIQYYSQLAEEIREMLINTTSVNGGHLASNLGVVELTLALHKIFNCPVDKIVWDVGHQSYTHKILTGRRNKFTTLRQFNGLSGFPKLEESIYDCFGTGHAGTSVSAALGFALSRDIDNDNFSSIAITGDGAFTCGMIYEALNQAGHSGTNITIILNDNAMSISKNVGALSKYFLKLRTMPVYSKVKKNLETFLRKIPALGNSFIDYGEKFKDIVKHVIMPGAFFEEIGFKYIGPINGHNIQEMLEIFENTRKEKGPIVLHVLTQKGKGYKPAETNSDKFHGIGPFSISTGKKIKKKNAPESYTKVFSNILVHEAQRDKNIVAITAAMKYGSGLEKFAEIFPTRFFDVGIAEEHAVTLGSAIASTGKKVIISIYSTFLQRSYDNIIHDVCLQNIPVIFMLDRAGVIGEDGPTHNGVFDLSYLRHIPLMNIAAPKDEVELKALFRCALELNKPIAIRYPKENGVGIDYMANNEKIIFGTGERLIEGQEIVLLAIGSMVQEVIEAARLLQVKNIYASVINMRFIKPLDEYLLLNLAKKNKIFFTIEDNIIQGGFGSAILEFFNENNLMKKLIRLGFPDKFIEQGPRKFILEKYNLSAKKIAAKILRYIQIQNENE